MPTLPPDRGHVLTEQRHPASWNLDARSTADAIALMIDDHRRVSDAVAGAQAVLTALVDDLVPRLARGGRLVYAGAGTSGRLGVLDAAECPPTFQSDPGQVVGIIAGGDASLRRSSERLEDDPDGAADDLAALELSERDTLVGIAAGGTTPYVLGALERARAIGGLTALITCAPPRARPGAPAWCDHLVVLDTGPEVLTGSTRLKAGSATKLALNIITTVAFTRLGKVYGNLMVDLRATNDKLHDRAIRVLVELCPELSRTEADGVLGRAGGVLKVAIVMQRLDVDAPAARALLDEVSGRLRAVLDSSAR